MKNMRPARRLMIFIYALSGMLLAAPTLWGADTPVDHAIFAALLSRHVTDGNVDYRGFQQEETRLDTYLQMLAGVKVETLPRNDQFAFYINLYNAWTIKLILSEYPDIDSIKDVGGLFSSPWKKKIVRVNAAVISLDTVEHDILRPRFKDPRVHFAINCASKGCPPLRAEPYEGSKLDHQLNEATAAFLNDPVRNRLEGDTLFVSKIFKWFSDDFDNDIVGFFSRYAGEDLRRQLRQNRPSIRVEYLDYDWSLNGY